MSKTFQRLTVRHAVAFLALLGALLVPASAAATVETRRDRVLEDKNTTTGAG